MGERGGKQSSRDGINTDLNRRMEGPFASLAAVPDWYRRSENACDIIDLVKLESMTKSHFEDSIGFDNLASATAAVPNGSCGFNGFSHSALGIENDRSFVSSNLWARLASFALSGLGLGEENPLQMISQRL